MSGRAGWWAAGSWLTFWLTFWQIWFSHKVFNLRSSNFTHGFFRVSAFMWCHVRFSWLPIFWWKMHFLEIFLYLFFHKFLCIFHNSKTILWQKWDLIWEYLTRDYSSYLLYSDRSAAIYGNTYTCFLCLPYLLKCCLIEEYLTHDFLVYPICCYKNAAINMNT